MVYFVVKPDANPYGFTVYEPVGMLIKSAVQYQHSDRLVSILSVLCIIPVVYCIIRQMYEYTVQLYILVRVAC